MSTLDVTEIVVALDGSPFAEVALRPASELAAALGSSLRLVRVVGAGVEAADAERYLAAAAGGFHATWSVLAGDAPADALAAAVGYGDRVLGCLATHGRGRAAAVLGSVADAVLRQVNEPLLLVGPTAQPPGPGPVVVLAGGHDDDRDLVDTGLAWGDRLDRPVHVVRAAHLEPAPVPDERPGGALADPGAQLAALLDPVHPVRRLDGEVVRSPLGVRDAIATRLPALHPAIVVVGSHRHHGLARLVAGDHGADTVHDAPAPALAVPLGLRS